MLLTTQEIDYLLPSGGRFALPALLSRPLSNQQQLAGTNRLLGDDRQAILTALNRSLSGPLRFGSRPPNNVAFENSSMIDSPFFSQVSSAMGGTSHITAAARQKLPPASGQQIASRSINEGARSSDIGVVVAPAAAAIHDSQRVLASASPAAINRGTPSSSNKSFMIYTPNDEDNLTAYQCLARKYIEFFETNEDDLNAGHQGRNKPIVLKQVGIRCCLCANLPHRQKSRAHSYYPSHIVGIYQAAQNIASAHLNKFCQCVPGDLRRELLRLYAEKTISKGGKKYWATSARALGVCEAEDGGLRFDGGRVDEETSLNRETGKDEGVTK